MLSSLLLCLALSLAGNGEGAWHSRFARGEAVGGRDGCRPLERATNTH